MRIHLLSTLIEMKLSEIDLPSSDINSDIMVTRLNNFNFCLYKSSRKKVYGLGYNLFSLVYEKIDTE